MKNNQENKVEDLVENRVNKTIRIQEYKGNFNFTIPAKELRKINAKIDDYLKIILRKGNDKAEYYARIPPMPKSRTNLQVRKSVPKRFVEKANIKKHDKVELQVFLIDNIRSNNLITSDNHLDILSAIPEKTNSGKTIMVDLIKKEHKQRCKIWYCAGHGGKAKEIELKRFIKIDKKLGEFFGLMQAESRKKGKRFDFTNKFLSEVKLFIEISERFGIPKSCWNHILFYKPYMEKYELVKHLDHFSKEMKILEETIIPIKNKSLLDVIYNINIPLNTLAEVMINIMIKVRNYISDQNNLSLTLKEFAKGFILKDLLGDGTVVINNANKGLDITISESNFNAQKDIIKILNFFGINAKTHGIKIDVSSDFNTCLWFIKNNAFVGHKENRKRLLYYVLQNYYFNSLYSRIKDFESLPIQEFASKHNLPYKTAQMFLMRNKKRGYFTQIRIGTYEIAQKGREFLQIIKKSKKEMTNLLIPPKAEV